MARNFYNVQTKQWKKWGNVGQEMFNRMYRAMTKSPDIFQVASPPHKQPNQHKDYWKVIAWNVAWTSASEAVDLMRSVWPGGEK